MDDEQSRGPGVPENPEGGVSRPAAPAAERAAGTDARRGTGKGGRAGPGDERWERTVLERLVGDLVVERKRARRWGIFFKMAAVIYVGVMLAIWLGFWSPGAPKVASGKHTALINVKGVIEDEGEASADAIMTALRSAFEDSNTAGVVLRINSPGGSPVQSGIIHDEIRRLRDKYPKIPVHAVVEDLCASGGYYIAVAADRIHVEKASMVGSIGVLIGGFGFVGTMDKLGVERRLLTAGANKGFLDSFSPLTDAHRDHAQQMIDEIHQQFIRIVRDGRKGRLKETKETFSGLVWTGEHAVEIGLADALGSVDSVARDVIKAENIVDFTTRQSLIDRVAKRLGASAGEALARNIGTLETAPRLR